MSTKKSTTKRTFTEADKAKWSADKADKVERAKALLADGVRALQTSDDWRALLTRVARSARRKYRVSRYSFTNQLLVAMQAPDATMTAGFKQWLGAGRCVKKGEKAIMIRQPKPWSREEQNEAGEDVTTRGMSFGIASVFSYEQTEGDEISEVPSLCETLPSDAIFSATLEQLRGVALAIEGGPVTSIEVRKRTAGDLAGAAGWYTPATKAIVIIDNGNAAEMFSVLAHEVGHALMHPKGDHHETPVREVEAESVAFIVCNAVGLDTSKASFPYVASWAGKNTDAAAKVLESGERITRAASVILDALYGARTADAALESEAA
jgi:antirestriction protein ArdC